MSTNRIEAQARNLIDELDDVLEREREALLEGDLECLMRLLDEKETLIDQLNLTDRAARDELTLLQDKVARNQALLDGALEGIRTVANRMGTLRRIRRSLDTYDETGRKTTFQTLRENKVEKRA